MPLATIPDVTVKAVLAIEDRRFYGHPGVDPIRMVGALRQNLRGDRPYLEGASTITQQLVKNVFLAEVIANPTAKSYRRKVLEQMMAIVLERRASKAEILEAVPERRIPRASGARSPSTASPRLPGSSSARTSAT